MLRLTQSRPEKSGFSLVEVLLVIAIIAVLLSILFPVTRAAINSSRNTGCVSNLRALHLAFNSYATDNNDCFPPYRSEGTPWPLLIQNYLSIYPGTQPGGKQGITYCPSTKMTDNGERVDNRAIYLRDAGQWKTDYNANPNVCFTEESANKRATMKGSMVFLFEGAGGVNLSISYNRHAGMFNTLFVDGHVEAYRSLNELKGRWAK